MRHADFRSRSDISMPTLAKRFAKQFANRAAPVCGKLVQFALPNLCALCGNMSQRTVCDWCDDAYWNEPRLRCITCAVPLARDWRQPPRRALRAASLRCADCAAAPRPFDATLALADYRAPLDALVLGLKFRARLTLAGEFARRLAERVGDLADDPGGAVPLPDVIAPVPLARRRLVERGHNQAWQIARPLARALGVRADATLLRRVVETAPQSRLDLDARRQNVACAFEVASDVRGLHVGVVDDVMTTGATLEAVARVLKQSGARRVTSLVALRTPKN